MNPSRGSNRPRRSRNSITTRSGKELKLNRSMSDRMKSNKLARKAEKAAYLSTLPKNRFKRTLYRMHPKRVAQYWFSREGGIMALKIAGICIIVGFLMTLGLFAYFRKDLPQIKNISGGNLGGSITYYDRTGKTVLWQDYDGVKRLPVEGDQISKYIKQATIAIEDKDFYNEGAFNVRGITRAALNDVFGGGGAVQGGSTITQQLVKLNQDWTNDRTITRKVKELILAVELEREYSKDDILTGYLNIAPYGGVDYGVQSAAKDYFRVDAKDLSLAQATMLAAIPQAPSYYSPYASSEFNPAVTDSTFDRGALIGRQHYILDQMVEQGYITKAQAEEAKKVDVLAQVKPQTPKYKDIKAPYFVLSAKQELIQTYGAQIVARGGWKVITTLDMNLQKKAEDLVASNLSNVSRYGADEEAMVAEDVQTGQIVSLVGGTDFFNDDHGQDNFGSGILLPPGSSFKPYDYATFINNNNNVGAGSVLYDTAGPLPGYPCTNKSLPKNGGNCLQDYDFLFPGPVTLRYALGGSRNVPAVKAMLQAVPNDKSDGKVKSINKVISTASAMMANKHDQSKKQNSYNCYADEALTKTTQCYQASAIGDGAFLYLDDHVNGLSTLARMGKAIPRTYIMKIADSGNKTIYEYKKPESKQVLKADAAYIVNNMASDPRASYLPGNCNDTNCTGYKFHRYNGWHFAVKTGTTNDGYDGLMTSWSTKYAVVSWVGHHTRHVTLRTSMENLTEPLTRGWMEYAHKDSKASNWKQPSSVKTGPAYVLRKHIHYGDQQPSPTNDLYPGWYVGGSSNKNTSQTIDKVSGAVATSCTPAAAKEVVGNANAASWNVDSFVNGGKPNIGSSSNSSSTSSTSVDTVHKCGDSPPAITLTAPTTCDNSCIITATVTQGTHPLSDAQYPSFPGTVRFTLNGKEINTQKVSNSPSTVSFTYKPTVNGTGTLSASVTDSVLYSGSTSTSFKYKASTPLTLSLNGTSGSTAFIQWSGGNGGSFSAFLNNVAASSCQNVTASNCNVSGLVTGSNTIYIKNDSTGQTSNTINVNN